MFRVRILDSKVEAGMPSCAAAPAGPETRPWASAKAASMIVFSSSAEGLPKERDECPLGRIDDEGVSQPGSTEKISASQITTERSMTFCNSRIFPGQE